MVSEYKHKHIDGGRDTATKTKLVPIYHSREILPKLIPYRLLSKLIPIGLLRVMLSAYMRNFAKAHPEVFQRLGVYGEKRFLIRASDLSFVFLLEPSQSAPRVEVYPRDATDLKYDAAISGTLPTLLKLVGGSSDGDAEFFSRDLTIEGDTEAVVALRNAIDNAELSFVKEAMRMFWPL